MATPLYTRGLAAPVRDGPFHTLDLALDTDQQFEIHATGQDAAHFLLEYGLLGQFDSITLPIPQECPHTKKCRECASAESCTHEKQCATNGNMWRSEGEQQKRPYAAHLSDTLAQHLLRFFIEDVEKLRSQVRGLLQSHGDLILKRWKKLSKDKRGRLLSDTAPQVFGPWPVVSTQCTSDDCFEEHIYQRPGGFWLKLQDIAEDPMKLLSILQCVTMCGNNYGTLCRFDAEGTHAWSIVGFPRAFLTIQIQHQLHYTLRNITQNIIKDSPGTGATCCEALVAGGLRASGGDAAWCSYTHQAFAPPKAFDPKLAFAKARAHLEMIQDQLWLMQTDPGYMQAVIHSKRLALRHVVTGMYQKDQVAQLGGLAIDDLITRFHLWYTVVQALANLRKHIKEHESSFKPGQVLPIELSAQFDQVKVLIHSRLQLAKRSFTRVVHKEPICENGCCIPQPKTSGGSLNVKTKHGLDPQTPAGRLQWRLRCISQSAKEDVTIYGYAFEIKAMVQDDKKAKLMDRSTYDFLSDMMALDDINFSFDWSQHVVKKDWMRKEHGLHWEATPCSDCKLFDDRWVARIGPLVASFLEVPWPKGPNSVTWLEAAIECRKRLGLLLKPIRDERNRISKSACQDLATSSEMFRSAIAFDSEPEYLAQVEEELKLYNVERAKAAAAAEAQLTQEEYYPRVWVATSENGPVSHKQTKAKAKRIAGALGTDLSQLEINEQRPRGQISELPAIAVKRDSLSVFRKMYTPGNQGDIRWSLFVQAMVDAGFKATEAAGSAMSFSNDSGSICFHRPHPDPVIDPIMLHNMARRMQKWFGWSYERFMEREK